MIRAGIDIGAGRIRTVMPGRGIVYNEPCLAALDRDNDIVAIGSQAELFSKGKDITVRTPFQADRVDFDLLLSMLEELCYELNLLKIFHKTSLLISYPSLLSNDDVETLKSHLMQLGADEVFLEPQITMAALGTGLNLFVPVGSCVMNIGLSSCDIAMFRSGQISAFSAGSRLNIHYAAELLQAWVQADLNTVLSLRTCHEILASIGCVAMQENPLSVRVQGVSRISGQPVEISINENQVAQAMLVLVREWGRWINEFTGSLGEYDRQDLQTRGIIACGGGVCFKGVPELLQTMAGVPLIVTDNPLQTTCEGVQRLLESMENTDA